MERTYELDRAHVFHSWLAQAGFKPMVITSAQGSYVVDGEGNRLLDFSSQLVNTNIGHQHPKVVAGIKAQADRLCTVAPQYANDQRSEAARLITDLAPDGMNKVFFTNAGAEAVENAVRMARLHTGRIKVLSTYRSYHGGTNTAVNLTGDPRRWANDYGSAGVAHFFGPFLYRSAVPLQHRGRGVPARARAPRAGHQVRGRADDRGDHPRVHPRDGRHHGAAAGLPQRRARAVRQVRHRVHRRRGHGRLRPHRQAGSRSRTSATTA